MSRLNYISLNAFDIFLYDKVAEYIQNMKRVQYFTYSIFQTVVHITISIHQLHNRHRPSQLVMYATCH